MPRAGRATADSRDAANLNPKGSVTITAAAAVISLMVAVSTVITFRAGMLSHWRGRLQFVSSGLLFGAHRRYNTRITGRGDVAYLLVRAIFPSHDLPTAATLVLPFRMRTNIVLTSTGSERSAPRG